jgi:hypothetical protein
MPSKLLLFCFSATEGINNSPHPHLEGALALLFQSSMVVTHPRIMLSKVSAVAMDINFFNRDTVRQPLTVTCDRQWGVIKVGSRHGLLPMAWVRECPGVILLTLLADRRNTFFFGIINHAVPICRRNRCAFIYDRRFTLVPSKERLWEHSLVWTQRTAIHCQDKLFVRVESTLAIDFSFLQCCICIAPLGPPLSRQLRTLMIYNTIGRYSIVCVHLVQLLDPREPRLTAA